MIRSAIQIPSSPHAMFDTRQHRIIEGLRSEARTEVAIKTKATHAERGRRERIGVRLLRSQL
jgi:hypothetical protein